MNRLILALALVPALVTTGAMAQTVSDGVTKALWCGTAFVAAYSNAPPDATPELLAEAKTYIDAGNLLIEQSGQAHLDAGFTAEQLTTIKADLVTEITPIVTGESDPSTAKFTFEDCVALLPAPAAPADTSSSAQ